MRNHIYRATYRPPAVVASVPWTPLQLPSLVAWLDAKDETTFTLDGSGKISEWRDKSTNGNHVSQATAADQPDKVGDVVRFNSGATTHLLARAGTPQIGLRSMTLRMVMQATSLPVEHAGVLFSGDGATSDYQAANAFLLGMTEDINTVALSAGHGVIADNLNGRASPTGLASRLALFGYQLIDGNCIFWNSGSPSQLDTYSHTELDEYTTGGYGFAQRYYAGAWTTNGYLRADIAEVVIVNNSLSNDEQNKLDGYLAHKWGLASFLPADHPYKDDPPLEVSLLDTYPGAAAAYSLRQLRAGAGGVVRVRRSSDDAESDFTAEQISNGALASWVGAADGFVRIWYDQSGNDRHAEQATAANQPLLVSSGTLVTENGRPAMQFPDFGSMTVLQSAGGAVASFSTLTLFTVFQASDSGSTKFVASVGPATGGNATAGVTSTGAENANAYIWGGTEVADESSTTTGQLVATAWFNGANVNLQRNAASPVFAMNDSPLEIANDKISLGSDPAGMGSCLNGKLQEVVIYFENRSSQIEGVVGALDSYYGVF